MNAKSKKWFFSVAIFAIFAVALPELLEILNEHVEIDDPEAQSKEKLKHVLFFIIGLIAALFTYRHFMNAEKKA